MRRLRENRLGPREVLRNRWDPAISRWSKRRARREARAPRETHRRVAVDQLKAAGGEEDPAAPRPREPDTGVESGRPSVSVGSRLTRRERRARRRRARLAERAGAVGRVAWRTILAGALVASLAGAVASVFAGEDARIILFSSLALLLYLALRMGAA